MKRNGAAFAAVVLAIILGNALAGMPGPIGYHVQCTDGIDNNQDGFIDGDDPECNQYPWADGNGESPTEQRGYFESSDGYDLYSDYVFTYVIDPMIQNELLCVIAALGELEFHQGEAERAIEIINELGLGCQGMGP